MVLPRTVSEINGDICKKKFLLSMYVPQCDLDRMQSVVNAAASLTADARKYDHLTPLLKDLHWLRVPKRVQYFFVYSYIAV